MPASRAGASRYSFDLQNSHEQQPLQLDTARLPVGHHEDTSETEVESKNGSSNSDARKERWMKWKKTASRWWLWELLGAIVSLACFVALIVVLRRSDGKEQTKWLYNKLTLNGLIALLSTFIRASMMLGVGSSLSQMKWNHFASPNLQAPQRRRLEDLDAFDQASRGPLGSLRLIFSRTAPHLGLIGALITIFTLAFDAFAQEVIIIRSRNEPGVNGTFVGEVPRSENYDHWTKMIQETNWLNDLNTIAAEYNGIFNYGNITAPVPRCSTGNCTWPVVPSLAVCGSCTDVTAAMNYSCVGENESYAEVNCTYTLHEGQDPLSDQPGFSFWSSPTGDGAMGNALAFVLVGGYKTRHYNESNYAYIDTWLMINDSVGSVTANVCGLWFCVQAYETSVDNGIPTQKIIGNWSETDYSYEDFGTFEDANFTDVPNDIQLDTRFAVDAQVLVAFGQNPIFANGNATFGADYYAFYYYTSDVIRSLQGVVDYNAWIDLFALGMSNNVRSTGTSKTPASTYAGTVLSTVPYVHVRWPWLIFPASMVAASLLFLFACIWQTARLPVEPWKGDALALLMASVDDEIRQDSATRWRIEGVRVRLDTSQSSAVFREAITGKVQ